MSKSSVQRDFVTTLLRQFRFSNDVSGAFLFGCALAIAIIVSPREVPAQQPAKITICKKTTPASQTAFNFARTDHSGTLSFFTLHDGGDCAIFDRIGTNTFREAPLPTLPEVWTVEAIHCAPSTSAVSIDLNPNTGNMVTIGEKQADVTCTFSNRPSPAQHSSLAVHKKVDPDPQHLNWNSMPPFPMTVTCTLGNNILNFSLNVGGNSWNIVDMLSVNSTCSVAEDVSHLPPLPHGCSWTLSPSSPTQTGPIPSGTTNVEVSNGYQCQPSTTVRLHKTVDPDPLNIGSTLSFLMTVTCTLGSNTLNFGLNVQGGSTQSINLPVGYTCTINETLPLLPVTGCNWLPVQYSPAQSGIVPAVTYSATVTNGYKCQPGSLLVMKNVLTNPKHLDWNNWPPFTMTVTCTPPSGSPQNHILHVKGNSSTTLMVPVGNVCSLTEDVHQQPPLPPGCLWEAIPISALPLPVTIGPGVSPVGITNNYACNIGPHQSRRH